MLRKRRNQINFCADTKKMQKYACASFKMAIINLGFLVNIIKLLLDLEQIRLKIVLTYVVIVVARVSYFMLNRRLISLSLGREFVMTENKRHLSTI